MGNCKSYPEPDTSNICTKDSIGSGDTTDHTLKHFCAPINGVLGGEDIRREYCGRIGSGEWEYQGEGGSCNYNDCNKYQDVDSGCCSGCCGISGRKVLCKRKSYLGDPLSCCLKDYAFDENDSKCFNEGKTCFPENRDITSSQCDELVQDYCTGVDLDEDDTSWIDRWGNGSKCIYSLNRNLFGSSGVNVNITSGGYISPVFFNSVSGFESSSKLIDKTFKKYASQGFEVGTLPGLSGYNEFQNILFKICESSPGICQTGLNNLCVTKTTEDLTRNVELIPWCGCYMPNGEYLKYIDTFQINKECTPICARTGNIKLVDGDGITPVECSNDICVIDNVSIEISNSEVGDISFSQMCGGCSGSNVNHKEGERNLGSATCSCVISDLDINASNSSIGGINLSQYCGKKTKCYSDDVEIDCDTKKVKKPNKIIYGIVVSVIVLVIITILILISIIK
ncbi:MAG: hypothetical protein JKY22_00305 [Flavobacteriaceae bacterium]|nr:hypothetical protein [Flavobacteriaceae bacterium]